MFKKIFGLVLVIGGWTFVFYTLKGENFITPFIGLGVAMYGISFFDLKNKKGDKGTED